jgi:hypothetical protein
MKQLKLAALCVTYAAVDLYLLLGWFASAQPQRTTLWQKLYGPLTFDLGAHPEGYGMALLLLSGLATIGFMVVLVRTARGPQPAADDNPSTKAS